MPRVRNETDFSAMLEQIKLLARQHMAAEGTAALSLRAIARDIDVTAPALYRYFPSRDELITALIVDAFNALADALEAEDARHPRDAYGARLFNVLLAYRRWALDHPTDFQLIYGNPIPGYVAPRDVTVPAVTRTFVVVSTILAEAQVAGVLKLLPEHRQLPPTVEDHLTQFIRQAGYPVEPAIVIINTQGWVRIHGMIMLEMFMHTPPVVGDPDAFYRFEISNLLRSMGLSPP